MVPNDVRIWTGDAITRIPADLAAGDYQVQGGVLKIEQVKTSS
jgi:hypothetical protein